MLSKQLILKYLNISKLSGFPSNEDVYTKKKLFIFKSSKTGKAISTWHLIASSKVRHNSLFFKLLFLNFSKKY